MAEPQIVLVAKCDTHHALFGTSNDINYLDGFLLSAAYMFSDGTAREVFDNDREHENNGVPIERVVQIWRQQVGDGPWLVCERCADRLGLSAEGKSAASQATRRRISNNNEPGYTPEVSSAVSRRDALVIGYASRLVPSNEEMASLATFYDEIWLPHPCDLSSNGVKHLAAIYRELTGTDGEFPNLQAAQDQYAAKCQSWKLLYEEGILRTMPPFERFRGMMQADGSMSFKDYAGWFKRFPKEAKVFAHDAQHLESLVLALNRLDARKLHPELFISDPADRSTARLAGILNSAILACRIPVLASLNAEQVLELRQAVRDSRSGYRQYLNQLTDELEKRISTGAESELEIARKIAERKVIPEYENYLRVLRAREVSFGAKILQGAGKFLQVDASPWTPKFWGAILESFGVLAGVTAQEKSEAYLTNEKQAFHYLATVSQATGS